MTLPKGFDKRKSGSSNIAGKNNNSNTKVNIRRAQHVAGGIICLVFGLIMIGSTYSMTSAWTYVSYGPVIAGFVLCVISIAFFLRGFVNKK